MTFMRRKRQFGSLPKSKPNKHRMAPTMIQPMVYPEECFDKSVPLAARQELKAHIRKAHGESCDAALEAWQVYQQQLLEAIKQEVEDVESSEQG